MTDWSIQAPDGKVIQFPNNFTEQDVNREMSALYPYTQVPKPHFNMEGADTLPTFGSTLGRELSATGQGLYNFIPSIYRSLVEPPTPAEQQQVGSDPGILGRVGLALHRNLSQPIQNAAQWYGTEAKEQGGIPMIDKMLSVAPEGVGQGAASVLIAKGAKPLYDALPSLKRAVATRAALVETIGDIPIEHEAPLKAMQNVIERIEKTGVTEVPKPVSKFVDHILDTKQPVPGQPNVFMDRPQGIAVKDALDFKTDLNTVIWDRKVPTQIRGPLKYAVEQLDRAIQKTAAEQGMADQYRAFNRDFRQSFKAQRAGEFAGRWGGRIAGYEYSPIPGHSLASGYAGGILGEPAVGGMVRSVLNRPIPAGQVFSTAAKAAAVSAAKAGRSDQ